MRLGSEHGFWPGDIEEVHSGRNLDRAVVIAEEGNAGWNGESVMAGQRQLHGGTAGWALCTGTA